MPFFSSQSWSATAGASVLSMLIVGAVAFAAVRYVEWSSDANLARFMSQAEAATAVSVPILPVKGRTGCEQSNMPSVLSMPLE
ncbi:hypothetical protein H8B02_05270 [Bradyrhizobium sp. Pear77]|uniref:hypothetical protein n=1 Tax=Bradyrhizobium altum TaxID=1571202 RepID=UPI001E3553D4|nr:hypothetical protein [Bradyrhizobium altum]MCC8952894.1 hypothetical protein [Bradyrhizobium altum]